MRKKGVFITFEGNEGCGKSTQIKMAYDFLDKNNVPVFITHEPGGTDISDSIRAILLDKKNKSMSPISETLLYMASRAQLVKEVIQPKIDRGFVVLSDRWLDATIAYQGYGGKVDEDWIKSLGQKVTQGLKPDRTIFFDLPVDVGLKRAKSHKAADRMELKPFLFHQKVRQGYLDLIGEEPYRIKRLIVSPNDSKGAVHSKTMHLILDVLKDKSDKWDFISEKI